MEIFKKHIVVGGSRNFNDYQYFSEKMDSILSRIKNDNLVIISGHCRGTDMMAERYAKEKGYQLVIIEADWKLGRKAGPIRNKQMVDLADYAVAFLGNGPGTESLIKLSKKKGIPIRIIDIRNKTE